MIREPEVAMVASPRGWAQRLHRHLADHGGARVRATVLHPHDTLAEHYDVLIVDDTTSFLSARLVGELRHTGRRVLGIYDPEDPRGKGELVELGVDTVLACDAATEAFLEAVASLAAEAGAGAPTPEETVAAHAPPAAEPAAPPADSGQVTVVGGPPGGCGVTEVAVALAACVGRRGDACVLVDADEVAPSLAQRLGLPPYPNLRLAVEAVERLAGHLGETLTAVNDGQFWALPGLARATDWPQVRPTEVVEMSRQLGRPGVHVLVNVGHRLEDLAGAGCPPRYACTRALLAAADTVVGVGSATPVGVARLLEWIADVGALADGAPLHLVVNRCPASAYRRAEVEAELRRSVAPASLTFAPLDKRVEAAAWRAGLAAPGPFTRAVDALAAAALPVFRPAPDRRRSRGRRAAREGATP